jgi:hypothetical protein
MPLNKWTISILLMVLGTGCVEPYEPEIVESNEVMVIDGRLTDKEGIQTISISISSPYKNPQFQPVSGCVVRVEDEAGNGIIFLENAKGIYQSELEPDFLGVGKAYKLQVVTPDDRIYESEYDSLLACAPIDQLSYKLEVQGTSNPDVNYYGIRFYVDMKGSPEESRNYMWTLEESWEYTSYHRIQYIWDGSVFHNHTPQLYGFKICYLSEGLENLQVGSSSLLGSNEILQQPLHFVSNQTPRLQEKYSLLVSQHSLSSGAFLYWDRMRALSGDAGGLFETQPSKTTGNISNINNPDEKVLGYFFVSQVKEKRITVSEDFEFPIVGFDCPLDTANSVDDFGMNYPYIMYSLSVMGRGPPYAYSYKECHDCTYRGGVTTKPEYWDD